MSNLREWLGVDGSASSRKEQKTEPTGALGVPRDVGSKRLCLNEFMDHALNTLDIHPHSEPPLANIG